MVTTRERRAGHETPSDAPRRDGRTIADLLRGLRDGLAALVRQEVQLAKTEMAETARAAGRNVALLALGAFLALLGLIYVLQACARLITVGLVSLGVALETAVWLGPLILGLVIAGVGLALTTKALKTLADTSPVPRKTLASLKEDKEWATDKIR